VPTSGPSTWCSVATSSCPRLRCSALRDDPSSYDWSPSDAALWRATDELVDRDRISETGLAALQEHFDTRQIMDIVFTIGAYSLIAWAMNTIDVPMDDDVRAACPPEMHLR